MLEIGSSDGFVLGDASVTLLAPQPDMIFEGRIALSEGSVLAREADSEGPRRSPSANGTPRMGRYREGSRVPAMTWRAPSAQEARALWSARPFRSDRTVGIVRLFNGDMWTDNPAIPALNTGKLNSDGALEPWVLRRVASVCDMSGPLSAVRVVANPPHSVSTTFVGDECLGLHVDDGAGVPIRELPFAYNRISVNVGPGDRFFVFVNLTVADMARLVDIPVVSASFSPGEADAIGQKFLSARPRYPVVRLRVRPGEAYVAPTENLLHDGQTSSSPCKHLTFTGNFHLRGWE